MPRSKGESCSRKFDAEGGLTRHQKACAAYKEHNARKKRDRREAGLDGELVERERQLVQEEKRRLREQEAVDRFLRTKDASALTSQVPAPRIDRVVYSIPEVEEEGLPQASCARSPSPQNQTYDYDRMEFSLPSPSRASDVQMDSPSTLEEPQPEEVLGRGRHAKRATRKVIDMRPEGPRPIVTSELGGDLQDPLVDAPDGTASTPSADDNSGNRTQRPIRRVLLRVTEQFKTAKNVFKMWRVYPGRPTNIPDLHQTAETMFKPTAKRAAAKPSRPIKDIIKLFPNISSWRFRRHFWLVPNQNSQAAMQKFLAEVAKAEDFNMDEAKDVNYAKIDDELAKASLPWEDAAHGWRKASVSINIPTGEKRSKSARQNRRTTCEDADDEDDSLANGLDTSSSAAGRKFDISGIHYRPISQVLQSAFSSEKDMHYEPFEEYVETSRPTEDGSPGVERVYTEVYNSVRFNEEHEKLQRSPPEPGCNTPRRVAAINLYSDSTQIAEFGNSKLWPVYMFFGNQSKYVRLKPQARAAHHMAYMPSLPDEVRDFIRNLRTGKAVSEALLTHCRRELFHGVLCLLSDEEFRYIYEHGILVLCADGIERRLYPRIFIYSADYPEKVLLCNIRDKGMYPCPRCLVKKEDIHKLGTPADRRVLV